MKQNKKQPQDPKPHFSWNAVRKKQVAINWIEWLPYKYLMMFCCALKVSGRLTWSFSRGSAISFHQPTKRVEYLLTLLPLHSYRNLRWSGWNTYRAFSCLLPLHFASRKEVGLLVVLVMFWTCVWFRQSPQAALLPLAKRPLAFLQLRCCTWTLRSLLF